MNEAQRKRLLELRPDGKPSHPYVKSGETDVAATFRRIKRQLKEAEAAEPVKESAVVKPLRKVVK